MEVQLVHRLFAGVDPGQRLGSLDDAVFGIKRRIDMVFHDPIAEDFSRRLLYAFLLGDRRGHLGRLGLIRSIGRLRFRCIPKKERPCSRKQ